MFSGHSELGAFVPGAQSGRKNQPACLSVTVLSPAETTEPIKIPFGLRTQVAPRNQILDGVPHPPMGRGTFEGGRGIPL